MVGEVFFFLLLLFRVSLIRVFIGYCVALVRHSKKQFNFKNFFNLDAAEIIYSNVDSSGNSNFHDSGFLSSTPLSPHEHETRARQRTNEFTDNTTYLTLPSVEDQNAISDAIKILPFENKVVLLQGKKSLTYIKTVNLCCM